MWGNKNPRYCGALFSHLFEILIKSPITMHHNLYLYIDSRKVLYYHKK
mgnify:CR=1 FL=1